MNEGKPGPSGEEPTTSPQGPDDDFELPRPAQDRTTPPHQGDYELNAPRATPDPTPPGTLREPGAPASDAGTSPEPAGPPSPAAPTAARAEAPPSDVSRMPAESVPSDAPDQGSSDIPKEPAGPSPLIPAPAAHGPSGDPAPGLGTPQEPVEPASPAGSAPADSGAGASGGSASGAGASEGLGRPVSPADIASADSGGRVEGAGGGREAGESLVAGAGAQVFDSSQGPVGERRGPLHDPDPYSTPPYGEPGPWAPAPPVQHPATTTPAHGMAVAAPPVVPETPAQRTTSPEPTYGAPPVPAPEPAAAPQQGGPLAPVRGMDTARHGAVPGPASAPDTAAPYGAAPAPTPSSGTAPHGTAPAPVPGQDAAPQDAGRASGVLPVPAPGAEAAPIQGAARPPAPVPGAHPAQAQPGADPWGRYDPWAAAAAAPLQQAEPAFVSEEQRRRRRRRVLIGAALVLALVSGGVGGAIGTYLERNGGVGTVELPQAAKEDAARDPGSVAGIAAQALPSVVTLHVSGADEAGTGTGFVLDGRGHILTNNHVVEPAGDDGEITVTFNSGDTAEATVVGRDSGYDLAVVKVKGVSGLTPLPLGNSDNVRVGDPVVAIGAPFDLAGTVTSGIISARERPITAGGEKGDGSDVSYVDALQTDAPINPGNSGGPLLDAKAHVIGINSAIRSADGGGAAPEGAQAGSIGLGFAIPINQGKRVAEELINTGKATHPVIGITLDMEYGGDGARVAAKGSDGGPPVSTGGPGAKAGIKAGDVITQVDGQRVHSGEELIVKTRAHRPGDRLELTLERDGAERKVTLTLGSSGGG